MAQANKGQQQDQDMNTDDMTTGRQNQSDNPDNFANDPQRASEAGQKGGQR